MLSRHVLVTVTSGNGSQIASLRLKAGLIAVHDNGDGKCRTDIIEHEANDLHDDQNCAYNNALDATSEDSVGNDWKCFVDYHVGEEQRNEK